MTHLKVNGFVDLLSHLGRAEVTNNVPQTRLVEKCDVIVWPVSGGGPHAGDVEQVRGEAHQ